MAATPPKRVQPPTHPSVWIGLALSVVGLLVAMYAYSGTRVYDLTYAYVALAGGLVTLVGIMVSAWGRAIMASRAQRNRRATIQKDALKLTEPGLVTPSLPTEAESPEKKRFGFGLPRRTKAASAPKGATGVFAFRAAPPAPLTEPAALPAPAAAPQAPPEPLAPTDPLERVTLKCPSCANQFSVEGVRPMSATCPSCGFTATV